MITNFDLEDLNKMMTDEGLIEMMGEPDFDFRTQRILDRVNLPTKEVEAIQARIANLKDERKGDK